MTGFAVAMVSSTGKGGKKGATSTGKSKPKATGASAKAKAGKKSQGSAKQRGMRILG